MFVQNPMPNDNYFIIVKHLNNSLRSLCMDSMTIERIRIGAKEVILVGTAHISHESVTLAQETISSEKPELVGIELDDQRFHQLQNDSKWQATNIKNVVRDGKTYLLLLNIFLANLQRRLGESIDIKPGEEMLIAAKTASENNIPILLLDRNIQITMQRAYSMIPLTEKLKLAYYLLAGFFSESEALTREKIEEIKRQDIVTQLINELGQKAPTIKRVLVDERDQFIAKKILDSPAQKIVAIVGAGHLNGIKQILTKPTFIDEKELLRLPAKNNSLGIMKWIIPAAFLILIGYFLATKGIHMGIGAIFYWILITGTLSALGALLAKSHPFTIITAFAAAPITTLHPFLASGWFAAGIEAKYRSPQVKDFHSLNNLNSYHDFEQNRVTHLLLVAAYTNLGSMIGVVIAFPYLISLLR